MGRIALRTALYVLAAFSLCGLAGAAVAPASAEGEADPLATTITVKWQGSSLKEVFSTIFGAIDADYLLTDDVSGLVTMQRGASARDILDHVCATQNLHWWKKGGVYVVSAQPAPSPEASLPSAAAATPANAAPETSAPKQRFYKAKYWNPRDLATLFNNNQTASHEGLAWSAYYTALASGTSQLGPSFDSLQPFSFGNSRLGESAQFPRLLPSWGNANLPQQQQQARSTTTNQPMSQAQQALLESGININAPFAQLLPSGMTAPIAFEPLNLLVFEATDEAYDRFLELLRIFDQKPKQVILEVQFVTMSTDDAYALGVDWYNLIGQTSLATTGLAPAGNITLSVTKGTDFAATLSALLTTNKARLVNAPRIAAMNNFAASINFVEEVPYVNFSGTTTVANVGVTSGGATIESISIPTSLTITPRINADDSVTALLNPTISSYKLVEVPTPDGGTQQVPLTSTNTLSTLLNIKDGETMVIGGFVKRNDTVNKIKIPLLSDLPIIGNLFFTRTENNNTDSELLIFVTPRIIKDESETTTVGPF